MQRSIIIDNAGEYVDSGALFEELRELVAVQTVSGSVDGTIALKSYLQDMLAPRLERLGASVRYFDGVEAGGQQFLIGTRIEDAQLPTVLCYGHADVTSGQAEEWMDGTNPWILRDIGDRWYGRGAADNKGQHLINLVALRLLLAERGRLGFNLKFLFEAGEEIGSPGLAEFAAAHRAELAADLFLGSDGPRLDADTPTIFLGNRGGVQLELTADLRPGSHHSGNWGGLLRNAGTTLAGAIGTLVDGHGRITCPALMSGPIPASVAEALSAIRVVAGAGDPEIDRDWADPDLSLAEKVYGSNALEVLAMSAGAIDDPANAIPGRAQAILQLRHVVGTNLAGIGDKIQQHLDEHGYGMVRVRVGTTFPASRLDPKDPWVEWAKRSLERTTGAPPAILPNIGGSLPNHVFAEILRLPTVWIPHSYPGCRQHAPNEHNLKSIGRQGLQIAAALFYDLGANPPDATDAVAHSSSSLAST